MKTLTALIILAAGLSVAAAVAAQDSSFHEAQAALEPLFGDSNSAAIPDLSKSSAGSAKLKAYSKLNKMKTGSADTSAIKVQMLLEQANDQLITLQSLSTGKSVPAEYAESIRLSAAMLKSLDRGDLATPKGKATLEAIGADLEVKTEHATKAGSDIFGLIEVKVRTLKDGKEAEGYEITYVAAAFKDEPSRYRKFPRFSSPTSEPLAAGNYTFWASKNGSTGEPRTLPIGNGRKQEEIDLNTP